MAQASFGQAPGAYGVAQAQQPPAPAPPPAPPQPPAGPPANVSITNVDTSKVPALWEGSIGGKGVVACR